VLVHAVITIISSCYGGYDTIKEQPLKQTVACRYVMVADQPYESDTWEVVVEKRPHLHPRMAAKVPKCLPWLYTAGSDVSIWIDASSMIISREFVAMCLDAMGDESIAQWVHPERDCIYDEAEVSLPYTKYQGQPVIEQTRAYRANGHPAHWGLWATGCIARRHDTETQVLGQSWLNQQARWSYQDQLSEPPLLRAMGLKPGQLQGWLWSNEWLSFGSHAGGDV
jgi:hypothetical protein